MTSIALYSAPFNLETPFRVLISSASAGNQGCTNISERIDKLVDELRVQVHSHLEAFNEGQDFIPTSGQWVLFCLTRRTIIPSQNVNNFCAVLTPTKSTNVGEFIILPISKTHVSSETLVGKHIISTSSCSSIRWILAYTVTREIEQNFPYPA